MSYPPYLAANPSNSSPCSAKPRLRELIVLFQFVQVQILQRQRIAIEQRIAFLVEDEGTKDQVAVHLQNPLIRLGGLQQRPGG